jgi:hypothetical protein
MAAEMDTAQAAVETTAVMEAMAPTAIEAADIGNSFRLIQSRRGTAGGICCQPFFISRLLPGRATTPNSIATFSRFSFSVFFSFQITV